MCRGLNMEYNANYKNITQYAIQFNGTTPLHITFLFFRQLRIQLTLTVSLQGYPNTNPNVRKQDLNQVKQQSSSVSCILQSLPFF